MLIEVGTRRYGQYLGDDAPKPERVRQSPVE